MGPETRGRAPRMLRWHLLPDCSAAPFLTSEQLFSHGLRFSIPATEAGSCGVPKKVAHRQSEPAGRLADAEEYMMKATQVPAMPNMQMGVPTT